MAGCLFNIICQGIVSIFQSYQNYCCLYVFDGMRVPFIFFHKPQVLALMSSVKPVQNCPTLRYNSLQISHISVQLGINSQFAQAYLNSRKRTTPFLEIFKVGKGKELSLPLSEGLLII